MSKTWNITYYEHGQPVSERSGISHTDAVSELYRLSRGGAPALAPAPAPAAEFDEVAVAAETGELSLADA
jgi:hypothetical protein